MNIAARSSPDDTAGVGASRSGRIPGWRTWLPRATEPHILIPTLTILILGVIWSGTFNLIRVERAGAETAAAAASLELVNTYEAQVVRALWEIDQTLKLVKYVYETKGAGTLSALKASTLLPPELVFAVRVVSRDGAIIATTHADEAPAGDAQAYLVALRNSDKLWVGAPQKVAAEGWVLQFGRRLEAADGTFAGAVLLSVDPAFFVSGYDAAQLGREGMLGILGTDGIVRARRTGDRFTAGAAVDYASLVPGADQGGPTSSLSDNGGDGILRYTGTEQLFDFPLAVIVGLSKDEQLARAHRNIRSYVWRASIGSAMLIIFTTVLGRMSWQLARGRERESDAKLQYAQRVEQLAYHDGLTALPNRSLFSKLLSRAIGQAERRGQRLTVVFIDLDRFKQINDTLGHKAGDDLLIEVAGRLKACLRETDAVARLGGDEFVVLLTDVDDAHYAATVAHKILAAVAKPFVLWGQECRITASIGISTYPTDGLDEQTLTKNADIAMYQAKEDGKNNYRFYSEKLNANSLERLTLESSLRHALERGEFQLHYQPKRDIAHGHITGMEVLVRWQHPDLGVVAPMQFIPVAEETGLIVTIGKWVLQTACRQNVAWQKQGLPHLTIAVNLAARQFSDEHLALDIASILKSTGMEARLLEIEMHESVLFQDIARTLRILSALKAMGVKIAIDDFGMGYSSLAKLQQFPLDTIKIDRSFIRGLAPGADGSRLTEGIIAMGRSLSLNIVAQGVETKEQAEFLREHACDEFQGFYFNKPMSAEHVTEILRAQMTGGRHRSLGAELAT
ncbi:MAG: EAL domain-containing protein [Steroidobacteraceae bacterium]|jgi:diguanylate cyclase (GGDEF)-like protein